MSTYDTENFLLFLPIFALTLNFMLILLKNEYTESKWLMSFIKDREAGMLMKDKHICM